MHSLQHYCGVIFVRATKGALFHFFMLWNKVEKHIPVTPPDVDLDKLAKLESSELSQLIRAYVIENEALRRENAELYVTREQVMKKA